MMRSSRGGRPPFFSGGANSLSSSRSSSRSGSLIAALILEPYKCGCTLGHTFFPRIGRIERREPPAFLLELDGAYGKLLRVLRRQARALGGNRRRDLFKAFLAHRLGEDGIGLAERVDPVDKINIQ